MGGSSKSSSTNYNEEYIFNNADYAGGGGESGALAKNINLGKGDLSVEGVRITSTDQGAIRGAVDIAKTGISQSGESFSDLLETSEQLVGDGYDALIGTQEFAKDAMGQAIRFAGSANQSIAEQMDRVLSYANDSTRADTSQAFENIAKWGLIATGTVAAVWILNRKG